MEKMTNSKALAFVLTNEGITLPEDVRTKLENIKASIDKKNSGERKLTTTQTENLGIKDAIYDGMEVGKAYTITEMIKSISALADLSNQKVSSLVRQMADAGLVVRSEDKRKAYFTRVEVDE